MTDARHAALVSELWTKLTDTLDLARGVASAGPTLRRAFSAETFFVLRLDGARRSLACVGSDALAESMPAPRIELEGDAAQALLAWARGDLVRAGRAANDESLRLLLPSGYSGAILAGALVDEEHGPEGFAVLLRRDEEFTAAEIETFRSCIPPLRVALAHDRRFSELVRLRESALADKRALLARLQRVDISETVIAEDPAMREVLDRIAQVAKVDVPVLVLGETGTGKEVLARVLHGQSPRAKGPLVRVNCGAIAPGLVDSELFGHEKGSFTGAVAMRQGWFERADGGTLFLDEIGELSLEAQVRLLRVLQEGVLERVGGSRPISVDVRIVAATHRDLEEMVRARTFREDLWYRLAVFPVVLPPLRERRADIPALASHFAHQAGRRLGGLPLEPSADDVEALVAYDWPGNVRELAAVIERAAILGNGKQLDIPGALGVRPSARRTALMSDRAASFDPFPTLDQAMAQHIERALERAEGRIEGKRGAAELLGINPHTLRSRMRKIGLRWERFRRSARDG